MLTKKPLLIFFIYVNPLTAGTKAAGQTTKNVSNSLSIHKKTHNSHWMPPHIQRKHMSISMVPCYLVLSFHTTSWEHICIPRYGCPFTYTKSKMNCASRKKGTPVLFIIHFNAFDNSVPLRLLKDDIFVC